MKFSQVKPLCVLRGEGARAETSETFASLGAQEHLKVGKSSHLPAIGVLCCPGMEADPNWKEFRQQTQTVTHPQLEQLQLRPSRSPGVPSSCSSRRAQTQPRHLPRAAFHLHQPGQGKGMLRAQPRLQLLHRFIKHTGISWESEERLQVIFTHLRSRSVQSSLNAFCGAERQKISAQSQASHFTQK